MSAPVALIVGIYLVEISNHAPRTLREHPTISPASASRRLASEVDGGMQQDTGCIGGTLTTTEDAIDSAVLEWRPRPLPRWWDAGAADGRSCPDSGSRAAGVRRWSQVDAVTCTVGAPWMQRGAAEGSERTHASCSMITGTSVPSHGL